MNDNELAAQLKEALDDKKHLAQQLRSRDLEIDALRGQIQRGDKTLKDMQDERISLMAVRDNWKIKFDVCKQILGDLHTQLTGVRNGERQDD